MTFAGVHGRFASEKRLVGSGIDFPASRSHRDRGCPQISWKLLPGSGRNSRTQDLALPLLSRKIEKSGNSTSNASCNFELSKMMLFMNAEVLRWLPHEGLY